MNNTSDAFTNFIEGTVTLLIGGMFVSERIRIASGDNISKEDLDNIPSDDCILTILDSGIKQVTSSGLCDKDTILSAVIKVVNSNDISYEEKQRWINIYENLLKED